MTDQRPLTLTLDQLAGLAAALGLPAPDRDRSASRAHTATAPHAWGVAGPQGPDEMGLISVPAAAALLGVSQARVRQLASAGKLPGSEKLAGVWLLPWWSVEQRRTQLAGGQSGSAGRGG